MHQVIVRPHTVSFVIALGLMAITVNAEARTILVATTGSDSGDGSTAPYLTLAQAASAAQTGDVIQLGPGTFSESGTVNLGSGVTLLGAGREATTLTSSQSPILRVDHANGVRISALKLDGRDRALEQGLFVFESQDLELSYFRIDGFTGAVTLHNVSNAKVHDFVGTNASYCGSNAISFTEQVTDIEVYNGDIQQIGDTPGKIVGSGPNVALETVPEQPWTAPHARVTRVKVHDLNHVSPARGCWEVPGSPGNFPPGFSMEFWHTQLSEVEVYSNHVRSGFSIQSNSVDYGPTEKTIHIHHNFMDLRDEYRFAIEVSTHNMVIDHNYFLGGTYPIASWESGVDAQIRNLSVTHNVFAEQVISTLLLAISTGVKNATFAHNTVYATSSNTMFDVGGSTDIVVRNNILSGSDVWDNAGVAGAVDHNLFFKLVPHGDATLTGDPLFVGSGEKPAPWYGLAAGSPAIDAGVVMAGVNDGYVGAAPDLGAFESGAEAWKVGPGALAVSGAAGAGGAGSGANPGSGAAASGIGGAAAGGGGNTGAGASSPGGDATVSDSSCSCKTAGSSSERSAGTATLLTLLGVAWLARRNQKRANAVRAALRKVVQG